MPDTLIKFKTGALSKLEGGATDEVSINEGTVYFATDSTDNTGKIWFDDSNGNRIDMTAYSQESEYAALANNVDGVVAVANGGTGASSAAAARTNLGITPANLGISATTSSVTVGSTTFNKYSHPTTTETTAAAVKVGKDNLGHVVLGSALTASDVGAATSGHNHDDTYLKKSGGTLTGALTLNADPTANLEAATKQYVDNAFAINDAMIFKGVLNSSSGIPDTHQAGWTYRIGTTGTYAGNICEVGDLLICVADGTTASDNDWVSIQNNIDGALFKGTNAFTDGQVLAADGVTGKVKTTGYTIAKSVPSNAVFTDTVQIFWVTYNSTTASQISSAISANKIPILKYSTSDETIYAPLTNKYEDPIEWTTVYVFTAKTNATNFKQYVLNGSTWSNSSNKLLTTSSQTLSSTEKTQVRTNIGAASASDLTSLSNEVVKTTAQSLTDAQKEQARENIDAISSADISTPDWNQNSSSGIGYIENRTHYKEILEDGIKAENSTITFDSSGNNTTGTFSVSITEISNCQRVTFPMYSGEQYKVIFDNTEYTLTAYEATWWISEYSSQITPIIGNPALLNNYESGASGMPYNIYSYGFQDIDPEIDNSNIPFAIFPVSDGINETIFLMVRDTSLITGTTHTITFLGPATFYYHLDPLYLDGKLITSGTGENSEIFNDYNNNLAGGPYAHAEGYKTSASGNYSHTEGYNTKTTSYGSHAEGYSTRATGSNSHAEGYSTIAYGSCSHAEGYGGTQYFSLYLTGDANATTYTVNSFTDITFPLPLLPYNAGFGYDWDTANFITNYVIENNNLHSITLQRTLSETAINNQSYSFYLFCTAYGNYSHVEGYQTSASGNSSHAEGYSTKAAGDFNHTEGYQTWATSNYSHAEGQNTKATNSASHAEGCSTIASSSYSHAEGNNYSVSIKLTGSANTTTYTLSTSYKLPQRITSGNMGYISSSSYGTAPKAVIGITYSSEDSSIVTGITVDSTLNKYSAISKKSHYWYLPNTLGIAAHSEGERTLAWGTGSHAEGSFTLAWGADSHSEGGNSSSIGNYSHAEGYYTSAEGLTSHTEGYFTTASGNYSHAAGYYTTANHKSQLVFGEYNILDSSSATSSNKGNYVEIVGNGTGDNARSNARTLDWNGNEVLTGKLTVGAGPTNNMDVATKQYVDTATAGITSDLSGLTDTTISNPVDGQFLTYDSTTSKWVNTTFTSLTVADVNALIASALAEYGDGDTASYGYNDGNEVNY